MTSSLLFVIYDAGETHALEPVWEILDRRGRNYRILAFSTAAELVRNHPKCLEHNVDVDQRERVDDATLNKLLGLMQPDKLVTGMVSVVQRQLAAAWRTAGVRVLGLYDSFQKIHQGSIAHTFLPVLHELFVPAKDIKLALGAQTCRIKVVGQPSLERWAALMQRPEARLRPTVLIVGGYGEDYHVLLPRLLEAVGELPDCDFHLVAHPKVSGEFEREMLSEVELPHVKLVTDSNALETARHCDLIVCHRSTVGVQAAWLGIPVIYFDLPGATYSNLGIDNGVLDQVFGVDALIQSIRRGLARGRHPPMEFFEQMGIPLRASYLIANAL